jgi:ABC-type multidrug transport system fused ATPase/permease subunit
LGHSYLGIFVVFVLGSCFSYLSGTLVYVFGVIRAAKRIHIQLIESILGTTLRWLDTTPTSRVIARCTQDIRAGELEFKKNKRVRVINFPVDGSVSREFQFLVEVSSILVIKLLSIVIIRPLFLIPGVVVFLVGGACGNVYMAAQLSVKREMSNARAPVLGHFGAAIAGLSMCFAATSTT